MFGMRSTAFYLLVPLAAAASALFFSTLRGDDFLRQGDCPYYAWTTLSILHDGDLELSNQLEIKERTDLIPHEGFFAVSPEQHVVPKHSILLPLLSVPFVALFGVKGFLIANVVLAISLVIGVAGLAGNTPAARLTAFVLFLTSSWIGYSYNYSNDLLVASLIVWAYALGRKKYGLLAGLLAGLAIWAKVYAAIILLPLAILILPAGTRTTLFALAGTLLGIAPMIAVNVLLYGGPLVTGYDRDARVTPESFRLTEHYSRFNQPFFQGLQNLLFDRRCGMIVTAPLWFLWPLGLWLLRRERWAWAAALGAVANVLIFVTYDEWNATLGGNRFLFPAVGLGGALLSSLTSRLLNHEPEA